MWIIAGFYVQFTVHKCFSGQTQPSLELIIFAFLVKHNQAYKGCPLSQAMAGETQR